MSQPCTYDKVTDPRKRALFRLQDRVEAGAGLTADERKGLSRVLLALGAAPDGLDIPNQAAYYRSAREKLDEFARRPAVNRVARPAALVAMLAGLLVVCSPVADSAPARCNWSAEYSRTLAVLHEDTSLWRVGYAGYDGQGHRVGGRAGEGGALVDPAVDCGYVADVVRHEHMHLQQVRLFGSWRLATVALGEDRMEITADCASMLAGSRYTPYVDQADGCSERDLADAQLLYQH